MDDINPLRVPLFLPPESAALTRLLIYPVLQCLRLPVLFYLQDCAGNAVFHLNFLTAHHLMRLLLLYGILQ